MPDDAPHALAGEDTLTSIERALERLHRKYASMEQEIGLLHMLLRAARSEHAYLRGKDPT